MKKIKILVMLIGLTAATGLSAQGRFITTNDASINITGAAYIKLNNTDWNNSGHFASGGSTLEFLGDNLSGNQITGASSDVFNNLTINRLNGSVVLEKDISIAGNLSFSAGLLDLDGHDITLNQTNGTLVAESENSRIMTSSNSGGEVRRTISLTAPVQINPGNLGAVITSAANLGQTTISRGHLPQTGACYLGINRYFIIEPTLNTGLDATLRLYYFDAELNGVAENTLTIYQSDDGGLTWVEVGFDSRNSSENWVEKAGINSISLFSLGEKDTQKPIITCPNNTTLAADDACSGLLGSYSPVSLSDNCTANPTVTQSPAASTVLNGHNDVETVTLTADDGNGNTQPCTFTVTLKDGIKPMITCPGNQIVAADGACAGTVGNYSPVSLSDNCTANPTVTQSPTASTVLNGHNDVETVTLTADDGNGNIQPCTFTVTLKDGIKPMVTCPGNQIVAADGACAGTVGSYSPVSLSDNCTANPTVTQSPAASTVLNGHNDVETVTLTADDGNGNTQPCSFTVTLKDGIKPMITCPGNQIVAADGACAGTVGNYSPVSLSDNCTANPMVTQSPAASTVLNGHNDVETVTLTADDGNGNTQPCTFTVTLMDGIKPMITCPGNQIVAADGACAGTVGNYSPVSLSDNCTANPTVTQSPAASTVLNGHNDVEPVTLTADDGNGNTQPCTFTVTLMDGIKPMITCPGNQIVAADGACAGTVGSYSPVSLSDNCTANPTVTQSPAASTVLNGHNDVETVTLTADDGNGNTQPCSFTVTLKDGIKPMITCPGNQIVAADGACAGTVGNYSPVSLSDNCTANPTVTQSPAASTVLNGHNDVETVTLTADDGNGNTQPCSFTVTLKDLSKPIIICPGNQIIPANASCSGPVGSWNPLLLRDNCTASNLITVTQSPLPNTVLNGHNISALVTLTANDGNGNTQTCTFNVTLKDQTLPIAKCKNAVASIGANGSVTVDATAIDNGSSDNCSFSLLLLPNTFNCSNIGVNTVTLRATDVGSNIATCKANVTIRDLSLPLAKCKNTTIFLDNTGHVTLTAIQVDNGSTDNCSIQSRNIDRSDFDCSDIGGTQPVTLTVKDPSGNSASCISQVKVKDGLAPIAECEDVTVQLGSNGIVIVHSADLAANSSDNCSVWSYSPAVKVYTPANLGPNNLTITVKDWSGNPSTCVSVVTVEPHNGNTDFQQSGKNRKPGDFLIYPNPTTGDATMAFQLPGEQVFSFRIFDATGRSVFSQEGQGMEGENYLPLRFDSLPLGVYIIDFQSDNWRVQKQLVLQR
ncbi:MAG: HYR domain-containing protein [Saprospiraceae bacterium]|nr:HYR domain-containing protein [Saprospiraceae bacterium]